MITGHATRTDVKTGVARDLKVGDHFFVPMGSEMIWDVHEEFRKAYAMYETSRVDGRFC